MYTVQTHDLACHKCYARIFLQILDILITHTKLWYALSIFVILYNLVWQTWVDGSLAGIDASKKYIVAKSGIPGSPLHLLRKKNGKTLFSLPVEHGGSEIKISENEKYIWYGEESGSPKGAMLTIEGRSVKDY